MPLGTFLVNFAARLQHAEGGRIRICGDGSDGVDLIYTRDNGVGRAKSLGTELETSKRDLERILEAWGTASEELDRMSSGRT